jgi:hypothetical protein
VIDAVAGSAVEDAGVAAARVPAAAAAAVGTGAASAPVGAVDSVTVSRAQSNKPKFRGPIGPDPALGAVVATTGSGKGKPCVDCILVALTTCCVSWERTEIILRQLLQSTDNVHLVVFDDMSTDDTVARVKAMGLPVVQPPKLANVGLTEMMNLVWRYFYARPELQSMFVVNNDVQISPKRTFEKMNKCLQSVEVRAFLAQLPSQ